MAKCKTKLVSYTKEVYLFDYCAQKRVCFTKVARVCFWWRNLAVKLAEMAHFGPVIHTASGTLASGGVQQEPSNTSPPLNAKQRRLSRPNTKEEIRNMKRKRKERIRKDISRKSKTERRVHNALRVGRKVEQKTVQLEQQLQDQTHYGNEQRKRALCFWRKWKEENSKNENTHVREIQKDNLEDLSHEVLGEGTFGKCLMKMYRGKIVAVKYFKSASKVDVEREAALINTFDHPGLPLAFGISTADKPYVMVMEFYGVNSKSVTISQAAKKNFLENQKRWAECLWSCMKAIAHLHQQGYIHNDIKGDNILLNEINGTCHPVIIDFGKMRKTSDAKTYSLSLREQERHRKVYKHIAPELVRGTHSQSHASDIYAFGIVISLICYFNGFKDLSSIAFRCINGSPDKRPSTEQIISDLHLISFP